MMFKVVSIVDGDTFDVSPNWSWGGNNGSRIRIKGYNAPESNELGYYSAKNALSDLLFGKEVELKNPVKLSYGRLLCDVYSNGTNIADIL